MIEPMAPDGDEATIQRSLTERTVIDALPRAVVVTDPDGRIVLWNEGAESLFGWCEAEVVGQSIIDVLAPPAELEANLAALASVAAGKSASSDRLVMCRDGTTVRIATATKPVLDQAGQVVALLGISEEVSSVRDAEQRARDLAEHFGAALQAGGLGTWRWNMASGATVWDERLEALFGLPPGGFDGTFETYVSMLHPDDRDEVLGAVKEAVDTKSPYRVEHKVVWPDGSVHWISGAGAVTLDEHGFVTGTVGCSMDVTERIAQEQELQRLAAVAIEAADSERLQRERLEFLGEINDALQHSSTVEEIMVNVTTRTVPGLGDWCSIHVLPRKGGAPDVEIAHVDPAMVAYARELQARFPYQPDAPTGVARVIRTGQTEFFPDITDDVVADLDLDEDAREIVRQLALRSAMCVPLVKRGRVLGAMQFVMSSSSRRYTDDDVALARSVADRIASSIENMRLHEQQRMIAQTLQNSLLPAALPEVPGVEVAVRYWPAGEGNDVGGDFYDVFPLNDDGHWAVVVGDVCGTGPAAAALTGLARHSIRASAWHGDTPVEVLASLNHAVVHSGTNSFLTAVYAVLRTDGPRPILTVACGGHPPPLLVGEAGITKIGTPGKLLGMFDDASATPHSTKLEPGDVVIFYTDGATDVPPPHALDDAQLTSLVDRAARNAGSADQVADRVRDALESVLSFKQRDDDIALLIIRVT